MRRSLRTGSRVSAAPWTPLSDAGLAAWYDPSDPAYRTLDGSSRYEALADKSTTGKVALTQATEGARPTSTTLGGRDALGFDGSRWLRGAWSASLSQAHTVIVVASLTTASVQVITDNNTGNAHAVYYFNTQWVAESGASLTYTAAMTGLKAHAFVANGATSRYHINDFATAVASGNAGTNAISGRTVGGSRAATPANRVTGAIGDVIVTTSIDAATLARYAAWLTARYTGLTVTA